MNERKVRLLIITPRGVKFDLMADMLIFRTLEGDMGVLPGHEPLSAALGDGILRVINGETEEKMALFGGFAEVENDTVRILTSIAQRPEEIDLERAETDREMASQLLQERSDDLKLQSYQVLLRRALVRIEVSGAVSGEDGE